ncbi:MAG: motility protein A [Planctomycetota bacterium]|nr:MAG: motility protein A [Planctomycetota bacterium]
MDIATVIGLILGVVVIAGSIVLGGSIAIFINIPSFIVVVVGSIAAVLTAFPMSAVLRMPAIMKNAIFAKPPDLSALIAELVKYAEVARRDGILSLENHTESMSDEFIVQGVRMAVDGTDPELIEQIMEIDLENLMDRHAQGKAVLDGMGKYAPAFGMIGTLIGLVAMLGNMEDPSGIGAGMAVALLTTLYGAIMSNAIFLPMADKLALRSGEEALAKTIIIKGVMSIQAGDNPRVVDSKLRTFLPPSLRAAGDDAEMKQAA